MKYIKSVSTKENVEYLYTKNENNLIHSYNNKPAMIIIDFELKTIRKVWYCDGTLHNMNGPAIIVYDFNNKEIKKTAYYLNDKFFNKEEWENHPEMIEYRIKKLLNS